MPEVVPTNPVKPTPAPTAPRPALANWSGLAFWIFATAGLALFALGVLPAEYVQRLEMRQQLAREEARTQRGQQRHEDKLVEGDALSNYNKAIAREARHAGYMGDGQEPLPNEPTAPALDDPVPEPQMYETRLDRLCRLFSTPILSGAALVCGMVLIAVSLLCFNLPTQTSSAVAAARPPV